MGALRSSIWCVFLVVSFFAARSDAATSFSVIAARPVPSNIDFHFLYGSKGLFRLEWQAGTQADYSVRTLDGSTRRIIDRLLVQHFYGGVGLTDWFSVGADVPVVWINHFQDPVPATAPGFTNSIDLGDPRIEMKLEILSRYRYPVGVGFVPFVHIPIGNNGRFVGDETVTGGGVFAIDAEVARPLLVGVNLGIEIKESVALSNVNLSTVNLLVGGGAALRLGPRFSVSAEGTARTPAGNLFKEEAETPIELLGAIKYRLRQGWMVSGGGGGGIVHGVGAPQWRGFLALGFSGRTEEHERRQADLEALRYKPKAPSQVEWSIVELKPKCPADPSQFDPAVHDPGCPKYYELSEIAALTLRCPSNPDEFNPEIHDQECPKVYEFRKESSPEEYATVYVLAVTELSGKCPEDPTRFDPTTHDASCPKFFELKQTVALVANCPGREEDFDPAVHDPECPKVYTLKEQLAARDIQAIQVLAEADLDADGIRDLEDRCPDTAGVAAYFGCPEPSVRFKKGQMLGTEVPITFAFNRSEMNASIAKALNEVATLLINHPEILRVRIEGHSDGVGPAPIDRWVSKQRAASVKKFLEKCGVASERLRAVGLGAKSPVASGKTAAGRAQNRRATVLVLELVE